MLENFFYNQVKLKLKIIKIQTGKYVFFKILCSKFLKFILFSCE